MGNDTYYGVAKFIYGWADNNVVLVFIILVAIQTAVYSRKSYKEKNSCCFSASILHSLIFSTINTVTLLSGLKLLLYALSSDGNVDFPMSDIRVYLMGVAAIILFFVIYAIAKPFSIAKITNI